jgi:uncharacterized membrane protein
MTKGRLEAFSDGVFAIAITLLIIEVGVPEAAPDELWTEIRHAWPEFAAYIVSFFIIGIMWVNHHALVDLVRVVDRGLLFLNLLLLLFVVTIPFTTALLSEYIRDGSNAHVAAAVYSASMTGCSIGFVAIWWYIVGQRHLLHREMPAPAVRITNIRFGVGLFVYLGTIGLSFVSAPLTLAVHFVIALYYMFDQLIVRRTPTSS